MARSSKSTQDNAHTHPNPQVVLVLQGGGALGAFQAGVYQAMAQAGVEPDWVIGTSIGAINGAIIAGNPQTQRLEKLSAFWDRVSQRPSSLPDFMNPWRALGIDWPQMPLLDPTMAQWQHNLRIISQGVGGFFTPNPPAWMDPKASLGIEHASYYNTSPLRDLLNDLVQFEGLSAENSPRLTVGAVNAQTGQMRYFDSRDQAIGADHVMASGALAPAFGAIRIDGQPYWDGGLYSNTPLEAVFDDKPRRHSIIFLAQLWGPHGPEPDSIWDVMGRLKDIQYASRADSHIAAQQRLHRLRHIIRELTAQLPEATRRQPEIEALDAWGCGSVMHVVRLKAEPVDGQDQTKDIDFSASGVAARIEAGVQCATRALEAQPWRDYPVTPEDGLILHDFVQPC